MKSSRKDHHCVLEKEVSEDASFVIQNGMYQPAMVRIVSSVIQSGVPEGRFLRCHLEEPGGTCLGTASSVIQSGMYQPALVRIVSPVILNGFSREESTAYKMRFYERHYEKRARKQNRTCPA